MALVKVKPTSPGRRALVKVVNANLHKGKPVKALQGNGFMDCRLFRSIPASSMEYPFSTSPSRGVEARGTIPLSFGPEMPAALKMSVL